MCLHGIYAAIGGVYMAAVLGEGAYILRKRMSLRLHEELSDTEA